MANYIQGSKEWLEMRRNFLGASDAPVVMKVSPWKTPLQLWEEKLGMNPGQKKSFSMQRGINMEEEARKAFEKETGLDMFPQVVFHKEHSFMMASLDGLTLSGDAVVEIKCPGAKDHALAMEGKVPEHYMPQLQHQLACVGLEMLYYYSFDGTDGKIVEVKRDGDYIARLIEEETKFWRLVKSNTAPDHTERDYTNKDTPLWEGACSRLKGIDAQLESLKKEKEQIKQELISDANGKSCCGPGLSLIKTCPKGRIDYEKIPELKEIDLEKYRKPGRETWTLRTSTK